MAASRDEISIPPARQRGELRKWTRWKRRLPGVKHAILPELSGRSNPVLAGRALYVSTFSPGVAWALDAQTGTVRWKAPLGRLGGSSVLVVGTSVFAKTAQRLFCLSRATGTARWSFSPYGDEREALYTNPVVVNGVVFLGDRRGFVHALDAATGAQLWKVDAGHGSQVNSTPCSDGGALFFGTNGAEAVALRISDGAILWRTTLDGPCSIGALRAGDDILMHTRRSLFRLRRRDGRVRESWSPGGTIKAAVAVGDRMFVVRQADDVDGKLRLVVRLNGKTQSEQAYAEFGGLEMLHHLPSTKFVYDCRIGGLGVLHRETGERLFEFTGVGEVTLVDANRSSIFVLDGHGVVRALRHPKL